MKIFHSKYKVVTPWWRWISKEFQLTEENRYLTPIRGFRYDDEKVRLNTNGIIVVKKGFVWGASSLTVDTESSREGSCIHDAFYYLATLGVFDGPRNKSIKSLVDCLLHTMCVKNGMWKRRADAWFQAVNLGGGNAWKTKEI